MFMVLFGVVYFAAVVGAAASACVSHRYRRLALAGLPYLLACMAPILFHHSETDWSQFAPEVLIYLALTWAMVWGLRRQWFYNF